MTAAATRIGRSMSTVTDCPAWAGPVQRGSCHYGGGVPKVGDGVVGTGEVARTDGPHPTAHQGFGMGTLVWAHS